jgi:hypothetical protein
MHRDTWTKVTLGALSVVALVLVGRRVANRVTNGAATATTLA